MPTSTFHNLPEAKRQLILDLAIAEFAAHDYREASISRIVARAGIAKGSLYQYFADKRDLYFYLLQLAAAEKNAFFAAHPPDEGEDVFDHLRRLFRVGLGFQFSRPELAQIAHRAVYGGGPPDDEALAYLRRNSAAFFDDLIRDARARAQINPTLDPKLVGFVLNQLFTGFGDFLLARLGIDASALAGGVAAIDGPEYWRDIDALLAILQYGLRGSAATIKGDSPAFREQPAARPAPSGRQ